MKREQSVEIRAVKHWGEVGAGSVVPFVPKGETVAAAVPAVFPDDDQIGALTVRGVSLEDYQIYDGDILLCRRNFTRRDIGRETICIVFIHTTGELVAKKLVFEGGGRLTLRASGGGIKDIHLHEDDVELRGIVWSFQRVLNDNARFRRPGDEDLPF